ncbi:hypothetical protein J3F84DRAFT_363804 [Trichoderma pleuroticola]
MTTRPFSPTAVCGLIFFWLDFDIYFSFASFFSLSFALIVFLFLYKMGGETERKTAIYFTYGQTEKRGGVVFTLFSSSLLVFTAENK